MSETAVVVVETARSPGDGQLHGKDPRRKRHIFVRMRKLDWNMVNVNPIRESMEQTV
jgi:hypothetical protein